MTLPSTTAIGLLMAAAFLMIGLATGVWKYAEIRRSPEARAPVYVDIAHRAALMYAFAMTLAALLTIQSTVSDTMLLAALGTLSASFAFAITSYVLHGLLRDTDNQFRKPFVLGAHRLHDATADVIMVVKGGAEMAALALLIYGFASAQQWPG